MLNDYLKLLGDINWISPYLKLTTAELKPLFNILRRDPDPTSKRQLTAEAWEALDKVEAALSDSYVKRIDLQANWQFLCLSTPTEKAMAPHSSTLAWKIPWAEELGRLQSMGSRRV